VSEGARRLIRPKEDLVNWPLYHAYLQRANDRALRDAIWEPDIEPLAGLVARVGVGNYLTPEAIDPAEMVERADQIVRERAAYTAGDLLQPVSASFNIPWLEAIAGCKVKVHPDTLWAEPSGLDYRSLAELRFDPRHPWFERMLACHTALCRHAAGRFPVALPVMHGPLDIISLFRGPEQFCVDLYDRPQEVEVALSRLTDLWIAVGKALLAATPLYQGGMCSRMHLWLPGPTVTPQADATTLLSPRLYRRFGLPVDEAIINAFPYHTYHTHSTSSHILEMLADIPRLTSIQITLDPNGPPRAELQPLLARLARRKPLLLSVWDRDWANWCAQALPPAGISITLVVRRPEDWITYEAWMAETA
jgi:hypothetical protein